MLWATKWLHVKQLIIQRMNRYYIDHFYFYYFEQLTSAWHIQNLKKNCCKQSTKSHLSLLYSILYTTRSNVYILEKSTLLFYKYETDDIRKTTNQHDAIT